MPERPSTKTVSTGTAGYLGYRAELLAQLAFSRLGTVHVHPSVQDYGYDLIVVTQAGATLLVIVKAFSSIKLKIRRIETIRELRWQIDVRTLRWASTCPTPVVLFLIDGDTEHGRYLLLNDIAQRTSSGTRQTIRFPIENTIDADGIARLIAQVEKRPCQPTDTGTAQQAPGTRR